MIISNLCYLEAAESTNIVGGSGDMYQTFWQKNDINVDQYADSYSIAKAFRGDATAKSEAYNVLEINASNKLEA
jgi:hypothetical protein